MLIRRGTPCLNTGYPVCVNLMRVTLLSIYNKYNEIYACPVFVWQKVLRDPVYQALAANWGRQDIFIVVEVWGNLRMSAFGTKPTVRPSKDV